MPLEEPAMLFYIQRRDRTLSTPAKTLAELLCTAMRKKHALA